MSGIAAVTEAFIVAVKSPAVGALVKFVTVVSYFMHLKFDNKLFTYLFYSGLILAICVYCGFLATFKFFLQKG
jgi:hypothetical protein